MHATVDYMHSQFHIHTGSFDATTFGARHGPAMGPPQEHSDGTETPSRDSTTASTSGTPA
jgi:hypothetical protein